MCGRYALALRPSQVRRMLEDDNLPVDDAPDDDGNDAPRHTYNFAPGNIGVVYRADVPSHGSGQARKRSAGKSSKSKRDELNESAPVTVAEEDEEEDVAREDATQEAAHQQEDAQPKTGPRYILQPMKWGLVPSWTKRSPDYASTLKTINCRDDSLASSGGLWASMKGRKRCVAFAQGFYEWLKKGPGGKERVPYYIKRKDGKPLLMAGLWDCVRYEEGEEVWSYTVVTTGSNKQLKFLHDRMPVILEPEEVKVWLDPGRTEWNRELQGLLRPWGGELEVYQVSKEVGKVGNNSASFVVPVGEGKGSIERWFGKGTVGKEKDEGNKGAKDEVEIKKEDRETKTMEADELAKTADDGGMGEPQGAGVKREAPASPGEEPPKKKIELTSSPLKITSPSKTASPAKKPQGRGKISATSNAGRSPAKNKGKADGNQKITKFFGNSA